VAYGIVLPTLIIDVYGRYLKSIVKLYIIVVAPVGFEVTPISNYDKH
jgi:hypothetical protein